MALEIRAGALNINTYITDTRVPFGGWKQSGFGHEGGLEAVESYLQVKAVGPYR